MKMICIKLSMVVSLLLILGMISSTVYADRTKYLKPTSSDLSKAELKDIAAEFFSVKWGIPKEDILKAKTVICLIDSKIDYWDIAIYSCPGTDGHNIGELALRRDGTLYWWCIRSSEYYEAEPDLMHMGTIITPTEADATAQEIYEQTMEHLKNEFLVDQPEQYEYEMALVEEEHFSDGNPVWIVYVKDGEELLWKGLFEYTGLYMTLVPAQQEYKTYFLDEYTFTAYADDILGLSNKALSMRTSVKIIRIQRAQADREETVETLKTLVPLYKKWKQAHPRGWDEMEDLIDEYGWMAGF